MSRPEIAIHDWLPELISIVNEAGVAISALFEAQQRGGNVGLSTKADRSPLTEADRRAHEIICRRLRLLTPERAIVSEEDAAQPGSEAAQAPGTAGQGVHEHPGAGDAWWLVDPLDGTREFVSGFPEFTVNIALVQAQRPVFGIVHVPMLGQCYWGVPGQGAWVEDARGRRPIHCARVPDRGPDGAFMRPLRILASRQHLTEATQAWIAAHAPHEVKRFGSSLKFCRIAEGEGDCYPRLGPTAPWDTAAAQAVVEGAGGHVLRAGGTPLRYDGTRDLNPDFLVLGDISACRRPPSI
ncbi:MAG: 3'(2'),5'-bisphosphate nucleotidase CysQ [Burkholderiaceae bacterium]